MKIFVYRTDTEEQISNYLIYYRGEMGKWRLTAVEKCPTKKITRKFIRRFPNFVSNAPEGSIGKSSFSYGGLRTIYVLVQSYNII